MFLTKVKMKQFVFNSADRKERKSYAMFVNFGDPTPPAPHSGAIQAVKNLGTHSRNLALDVDKVNLPRCSLLLHSRPIVMTI